MNAAITRVLVRLCMIHTQKDRLNRLSAQPPLPMARYRITHYVTNPQTPAA
jgi:hypothetical protein